MLNPQQLINLPYSGMAERELKAQGDWQHCITDEERIEWLQENCFSMIFDDYKETWNIKTGNFDCWYNTIRDDIDAAASKMEAQE